MQFFGQDFIYENISFTDVSSSSHYMFDLKRNVLQCPHVLPQEYIFCLYIFAGL